MLTKAYFQVGAEKLSLSRPGCSYVSAYNDQDRATNRASRFLPVSLNILTEIKGLPLPYNAATSPQARRRAVVACDKVEIKKHTPNSADAGQGWKLRVRE
ncbi:hypothetical protein CLAIMM_07635 isoform 2 [Cladophialophora immunda]|nr:hypothetical protein CLAIMM_07635 isoform 2 [Cladophialophora immunda]